MTDTTPTDQQEYPLADLLAELANELEVANRRVVKAGRLGRLRWTEATIELGVTWEKKGDGGIDLKVVRLGGALTKANTTTISVRVVPLEPGEHSAKYRSAVTTRDIEAGGTVVGVDIDSIGARD